jgi:hypothetical protein
MKQRPRDKEFNNDGNPKRNAFNLYALVCFSHDVWLRRSHYHRLPENNRFFLVFLFLLGIYARYRFANYFPKQRPHYKTRATQLAYLRVPGFIAVDFSTDFYWDNRHCAWQLHAPSHRVGANCINRHIFVFLAAKKKKA